jgi:hypothetical protein
MLKIIHAECGFGPPVNLPCLCADLRRKTSKDTSEQVCLNLCSSAIVLGPLIDLLQDTAAPLGNHLNVPDAMLASHGG